MDGCSCDRCPAWARARLDFDNGHHLYLCGHHAREVPDNTAGYTITYQTVQVGAS